MSSSTNSSFKSSPYADSGSREPHAEATDRLADSDEALAREERLIQCVKAYQQEMTSDRPRSIEQVVQEHPDLAPDLQECLEALHLVGKMEGPFGGSSIQVGKPLRPSPSLFEATGSFDQQPIGDFQILSELGRGGMGIVYEARQLSLGRRVALKVLPLAGGLEPVQLQRFRNEAQAAANLHHPHIVPVHAVGCERGLHYYAMQLIEGQSCAGVIQQMRRDASADSPPQASTDNSALSTGSRSARNNSRKQSLRTIVGWIIQAASALEYAHQFGVVHRDIKPANLLLDQAGNLWVTDFGLAQFQNDSKLTKTGDLVGTLRYMSPEQIEGGNRGQDHRTDIYALGATLFELLTLRPLVISESYSDIVREITQSDPPNARTVRPDVPRELSTIIQKATSRSPSERYRSMRELADDLTRWLKDEPIQAKPPTVYQRLSKWRKRHWALVNSFFAVLVLCTLGMAWTTQTVLREQAKTSRALASERDERLRAEQALREAKRAVDVFSELGESELVNLPELRKLRGDFLSTALQFYRELVALRPDNSVIKSELDADAHRIQAIVEDLEILNSIDPLLMLRYAKVQREIQLDNDTWARLEPLIEDLSQRLQSPSETNSSSAQIDELKSLIRTMMQQLSDLQMRRLRQLQWQNSLPMTFRSLEIAAELNLTPEQRGRIEQIIEEEHASGRQPTKQPARPKPDNSRSPPPPRNPPPYPTDGTRTTEKEPRPRPASPWASVQVRRTVDRILQILNEQQRTRWNELIGEPF